MRKNSPRRVPCPTCLAEEGNPCVSVKDVGLGIKPIQLITCHPARREAFKFFLSTGSLPQPEPPPLSLQNIEGLARNETILLTVRDELYGGSWDELVKDLTHRLHRKPISPRLIAVIERDLEAIKGVSKHKYFKSGAKTICTSAVLAYFGIDACSYHYSGQLAQRLAILRKNGWAARSRNSHLKRGYRKLRIAAGVKSVGQARRIIARINKDTPETNKWGDPLGTRYMIRVTGHALLLDYDGNTIVDTDPRVRDKRKVLDIRAIFPSPKEKYYHNPDEDEEDPRVQLYKQMADITRERCGACYHPKSCCDPVYCESAREHAREEWGVELPVTQHPKLSLMGPEGCVCPPHLRPICTVHVCEKHLSRDPEFSEEYYEIREALNELESQRFGKKQHPRYY
jgi:hypothetical protein